MVFQWLSWFLWKSASHTSLPIIVAEWSRFESFVNFCFNKKVKQVYFCVMELSNWWMNLCCKQKVMWHDKNYGRRASKMIFFDFSQNHQKCVLESQGHQKTWFQINLTCRKWWKIKNNFEQRVKSKISTWNE